MIAKILNKSLWKYQFWLCIDNKLFNRTTTKKKALCFLTANDVYLARSW